MGSDLVPAKNMKTNLMGISQPGNYHMKKGFGISSGNFFARKYRNGSWLV
jgi:hypothetical protein